MLKSCCYLYLGSLAWPGTSCPSCNPIKASTTNPPESLWRWEMKEILRKWEWKTCVCTGIRCIIPFLFPLSRRKRSALSILHSHTSHACWQHPHALSIFPMFSMNHAFSLISCKCLHDLIFHFFLEYSKLHPHFTKLTLSLLRIFFFFVWVPLIKLSQNS